MQSNCRTGAPSRDCRDPALIASNDLRETIGCRDRAFGGGSNSFEKQAEPGFAVARTALFSGTAAPSGLDSPRAVPAKPRPTAGSWGSPLRQATLPGRAAKAVPSDIPACAGIAGTAFSGRRRHRLPASTPHLFQSQGSSVNIAFRCSTKLNSGPRYRRPPSAAKCGFRRIFVRRPPCGARSTTTPVIQPSWIGGRAFHGKLDSRTSGMPTRKHVNCLRTVSVATPPRSRVRPAQFLPYWHWPAGRSEPFEISNAPLQTGFCGSLLSTLDPFALTTARFGCSPAGLTTAGKYSGSTPSRSRPCGSVFIGRLS